MELSLNRIHGEIEGHRVALWGSLVSGLEILSFDGREVSRRRSFWLSTDHDVPIPELGVTKVVVRLFPVLRLELRRGSEVVAAFENPWALPLQTLLGVVLAGVIVAALRLLAAW